MHSRTSVLVEGPLEDIGYHQLTIRPPCATQATFSQAIVNSRVLYEFATSRSALRFLRVRPLRKFVHVERQRSHTGPHRCEFHSFAL